MRLTHRRMLMYGQDMGNDLLHNQILVQRFQAVAEETRLRIVLLLAEGERCVCELQDELDAGQSRLSFHLRKLKDAGVVADRRAGRWVYYSLVPDALEEMQAFLGEVKPSEAWGRSIRDEDQCCD